MGGTLANKDLVNSELKRIRSYAFTSAEGAFKQNDPKVAWMRRRARLKQDVESSRGSFCERKRGEKRVTAIRSDVL